MDGPPSTLFSSGMGNSDLQNERHFGRLCQVKEGNVSSDGILHLKSLNYHADHSCEPLKQIGYTSLKCGLLTASISPHARRFLLPMPSGLMAGPHCLPKKGGLNRFVTDVTHPLQTEIFL